MNTIAISSGNAQTQGIAAQLALPLKVLVTDPTGTPVSGVTVNFAITSYPSGAGGYSLSAASAITGADGTAQVFLTLGDQAGSYTVTATAAGLTGSPLTFTEAGGAIVGLGAVKNYLKVDQSDVSKDAILVPWIGLVSEVIESWLNQPVTPRPVEDILDGEGSTKLYLNKGRIVSILPDPVTASQLDRLEVRASALGAWAQVVENVGLFYLNPISNWCIELLDYRIFPIGWKNIRVYYLCGFSPIPGEIVKMAMEMVKVMWDESNQGTRPRLGMKSSSMSGAGATGTDSYEDFEQTRWKDVIKSYKRLT